MLQFCVREIKHMHVFTTQRQRNHIFGRRWMQMNADADADGDGLWFSYLHINGKEDIAFLGSRICMGLINRNKHSAGE